MTVYINHITITTGHSRRSARAEVSDETLALLAPWLREAVNSGQRHALPGADLAHYRAIALQQDGGLVVTVYADDDPLVTFGVAQRSRHGASLWALLVANFGSAPGLEKPAEPWCAVALHPALAAYPDTAQWLGDFERCIAWAWITRNPQLGAEK